MKTPTARGRLPVWAYGVAALVTATAVVAAAVWFAASGSPDDGSDTQSEPVAVAAPSPFFSVSAGESDGPSPSASPSTLPEMAAAIEKERAADQAAAGDAGLAASSPPPGPTATGAPATDADRSAARDWLAAALDWRATDVDNGPWTLAAERANAKYGAKDVQYVVVAATGLERIAYDALAHDALPKIVEVTDETNPEWDAPDTVTLKAAVVFGTGRGWARPGLRLLVNFQVSGGKVTGVFIDEAYVTTDPELLP